MPTDDQYLITGLKNEIHESLDKIQKTVDKINKSLSKNMADILKMAEDSVNKQSKKKTDTTKDNAKTEEDSAENRAEIRIKGAEEAGKVEEKAARTASQVFSEHALAAIGAALDNISTKYESMINQYTENQQRLAFNLIGSGMTYETVKNALDVLSTSTFVKQNKVYENLTNLVSQGITLNVSQRAFLQTTAQQVGMQFDTADATLNKLIQLQRADLTEARVSQMAGLKTFLEQNYQTSQYINNGFKQVSDALFEMQSIMSTEAGMATEKTIQTYLGSFRSSGGSAGGNIAEALGKIGSGDFSGLSEGMQNLMVMAASRAGLSYADLLTGGLDESKSQQLMTRLFQYVSSMSDIGGGNNVAMSAIAKVFGVSVSDIMAAQNMQLEKVQTNYDTSIASFLSNLAASTNWSTRASNLLENLQSSAALHTNKFLYDIEKFTSNLIGGVLKESDIKIEAGIDIPFLHGEAGADISGILGAAISAVPSINMLMKMGGILGKDIGGTILKDLFTVDNLKKLKDSSPLDVVVDSFQNAIQDTLGLNSLLNDYGGLNGYNVADTVSWEDGSYFRRTGSFSAQQTGQTTSGAVSNAGGPGAGGERTTVSIGSLEDVQQHKSIDDLYDLLSNEFPDMTFTTIANIAATDSGNNNVMLGSPEVTQYIVDMLGLTAVSTENILMILEQAFGGVQRTLIDMDAFTSGLRYSYGDWSGTGTGS